MIDCRDVNELSRELREAIMRAHSDPAAWLLALRTFAEALSLRPERCILLGGATLDVVAHAVVAEASKQGRTVAHVRDCIAQVRP